MRYRVPLRAAATRGSARVLAKASTYKTVPPIQDLADTVAHLRHERDVTLQTMIDTGYSVVILRDAHTRSPDDLAAEAQQHLDALS